MLSWLVCLRDAKFLTSQVRLVRRTRFRGAVKKVMAQLRKQNLIQVRWSVCLLWVHDEAVGMAWEFFNMAYQVNVNVNRFSMHLFFEIHFWLWWIMIDHVQKYHYLVLLLAAIWYRILVVPKFVGMVWSVCCFRWFPLQYTTGSVRSFSHQGRIM